jgi:hypothetical protein
MPKMFLRVEVKKMRRRKAGSPGRYRAENQLCLVKRLAKRLKLRNRSLRLLLLKRNLGPLLLRRHPQWQPHQLLYHQNQHRNLPGCLGNHKLRPNLCNLVLMRRIKFLLPVRVVKEVSHSRHSGEQGQSSRAEGSRLL